MEERTNTEEKDRRRGILFALLLHVLFLVILFLPLFSYQDPPPEKPGILVAFGEIDGGARSEKTSQSAVKPQPDEPVKSQETEQEPTVEKKEATKPREIVTSQKEEPVAVKEPEKPTKTKEQIEAEREAQRKAEEERKKAEEEARKQREYQNQKSEFADLLGGSGQGQNTNSGNQGDPKGEPDAKVLVGLSKGSGRVGGGLSDRGLLYEPDVKDDSQKRGKVVIKVCVNKKGEVISAEYTQRGSTTADGVLKQKALEGARQYKFSEGKVEEQCGTITFDFRVE